jgi:hypothetical protein
MSHIPGLVAEVFSHERRILNLEEEDDLPFRRITPGARPTGFFSITVIGNQPCGDLRAGAGAGWFS